MRVRELTNASFDSLIFLLQCHRCGCRWDADRNTNEFVKALGDYRAHGLLAVTVSLMGGSVCGNDPHDKSHAQCSTGSYDKVVRGFTREGELVPAYFDRLNRILEETDRLGMVVVSAPAQGRAAARRHRTH